MSEEIVYTRTDIPEERAGVHRDYCSRCGQEVPVTSPLPERVTLSLRMVKLNLIGSVCEDSEDDHHAEMNTRCAAAIEAIRKYTSIASFQVCNGKETSLARTPEGVLFGWFARYYGEYNKELRSYEDRKAVGFIIKGDISAEDIFIAFKQILERFETLATSFELAGHLPTDFTEWSYS